MILFAFLDVTGLNGALGIVSNTSSELKTETKSLGDRLDSIRVELQGIQKECNDTGYPKCDQISGAGLEQNANFSNLPNIDSELKSIQDIVGLNFSGAADKVCFCFLEKMAVFKSLFERTLLLLLSSFPNASNIRACKPVRKCIDRETRDIFQGYFEVQEHETKIRNKPMFAEASKN